MANLEKLVKKFAKLVEDPTAYLNKPEDSYVEHQNVTKSLYSLCKSRNVYLNSGQGKTKFAAPPELYVDGFGPDEIWAQIELENEAFINSSVNHVSRLYAKRNDLSLSLKKDSVNTEAQKLEEAFTDEDEDEEDDLNEDQGDNFQSAVDEASEKPKNRQRDNFKPSVVDDKFFKLAEMESFLEQEDRKFDKLNNGESVSDHESDIDLFEDIPSDEDEDEAGATSNPSNLEMDHDDADDDDDDEEEMEGEALTNNATGSVSGRDAQYEDFFDAPHGEEAPSGKRKYGSGIRRESEDEDDEDDDEEEEMDEEGDEGIDTRDVDEDDIEGFKAGSNQYEDESDGETVQQVLGSGADLRIGEKSKFEIEQEVMKKTIRKLEMENLSEKPWQLKGEITAEKRPENSLLEEHLQFDHTSRPAPLITEETTEKIEDIIRQRIKDKLWDDVERKTKPTQVAAEYKRRITLEQEKSKLGLAEVYEKEFLKQQKESNVEQESEEHKQLKQMMKELFIQLDALSSFHFTPKPPEPEVKLINNLPAVTAEEVIPAAVSDATLLAPEEVAGKTRGDLKSASEKDVTDRKRERRHKKKDQKIRSKHAEMKKMQNSLGNKYNKKETQKKLEKASNVDLKKDDDDRRLENLLKTSKSFFAKLQDQVQESKQDKVKKKKHDSRNVNTAKIKL